MMMKDLRGPMGERWVRTIRLFIVVELGEGQRGGTAEREGEGEGDVHPSSEEEEEEGAEEGEHAADGGEGEGGASQLLTAPSAPPVKITVLFTSSVLSSEVEVEAEGGEEGSEKEQTLQIDFPSCPVLKEVRRV